MKSIIVPTDFSVAAENAMYYAAHIASDVGAGLTLLHIYQMPVGMIDMPVLVISADEIRNNADEALKKQKDLLKARFPSLNVEAESRMGDVVEEVNEFIAERQIIAVVIGTKGLSGIEKLLFGNTAATIIRKSKVPVISVPSGIAPVSPRSIAFATDLVNITQVPAEEIISMVELLHARLHIVHIQKDEENAEAKDRLLEMLRSLNPTYHIIRDAEVLPGLLKYAADNKIDMLLVLPHRHSFLERVLFNLHTEGLVEKMPVPVLSIPEVAST